ncbi:MAG: RNA degradosome polyphosphate kinase, partial [Hyphomicrobiaceae bacterium]
MSSTASKRSAKKVAPAAALPAPTEAGDRYYNRELSWLQFNKRVLAEARNKANPLLERLRFVSIAASNLDEFFMVRAAGLIGQQKAGVGGRSIDGLTPTQQLRRIHEFAAELANEKLDTWHTLRQELEAKSIQLIEEDRLSATDVSWLRGEFMAKMFAVLTPLNIDPAHPFPFVHNKGLTLVVSMKDAQGKEMNGLIPIPPQLARFVRLPDERESRRIRFVSIETVIGLCLDELFPSLEGVKALGSFRVLRDSDIEYEEEAEDLTIAYEALMRRRR